MTLRFLFANPLAWYKKPANCILKFGDRVGFGHFAIQLETFQENNVYESIWPKSIKTDLKTWLTHYSVSKSYEWQVPTHLQATVKEWLDSHLGRNYSMGQIFWIGICILLSPLNRLLIGALINQDKYLICTEYGSRFMERFMSIKIKETHDLVGLRDMFEYCEHLEMNPKWSEK